MKDNDYNPQLTQLRPLLFNKTSVKNYKKIQIKSTVMKYKYMRKNNKH